MRHATARDIMTTPIVTVGPDLPFREVVTLMLAHRISGVPVVDEEGRLLGIVTEADLIYKEEAPPPSPALVPWHGSSLRLERIVDRHRKASGLTAGDLMTENVVTATEETGVHELAHLMLGRDINRIPIVRAGRVVGIVTRADILKVFTRDDAALLDAVRDTLAADLWIDPKGLSLTCLHGVVTVSGEVDRRSDRELILRYVKAIDGVVGVEAGGLGYRIDDMALGRVTM